MTPSYPELLFGPEQKSFRFFDLNPVASRLALPAWVCTKNVAESGIHHFFLKPSTCANESIRNALKYPRSCTSHPSVIFAFWEQNISSSSCVSPFPPLLLPLLLWQEHSLPVLPVCIFSSFPALVVSNLLV